MTPNPNRYSLCIFTKGGRSRRFWGLFSALFPTVTCTYNRFNRIRKITMPRVKFSLAGIRVILRGWPISTAAYRRSNITEAPTCSCYFATQRMSLGRTARQSCSDPYHTARLVESVAAIPQKVQGRGKEGPNGSRDHHHCYLSRERLHSTRHRHKPATKPGARCDPEACGNWAW